MGSIILGTMTWFSGDARKEILMNVTEVVLKSETREFSDLEMQVKIFHQMIYI